MIVESFISNARSLSSQLACFPLPVQLLTAIDATTAMAQLQQEAVDLVIVDSCLRGKTDGFELCRSLRSNWADDHIPIILILSCHLSLERCKGISAGADLLLHRPVVKEELLRMIQLLLGWRFEESVNSRPQVFEDRSLRRFHVVS
jgi:DNA-binding response OmpR family regulator